MFLILINNIENTNMKEFEKYMNIWYELNIIKNKINEYINQLNDDDMIYHVFYDLLRPQGIINKKDFLVIRKIIGIIHSSWFSIDFTNASDKKKYIVRFCYASGNRNLLILDYDTTMDEMINNFLSSTNRTEMKSSIPHKIDLVYNATRLTIKAKDTPIEKFFGQNLNPTVAKFDIGGLLLSPIGDVSDEV